MALVLAHRPDELLMASRTRALPGRRPVSMEDHSRASRCDQARSSTPRALVLVYQASCPPFSHHRRCPDVPSVNASHHPLPRLNVVCCPDIDFSVFVCDRQDLAILHASNISSYAPFSCLIVFAVPHSLLAA